MNTTTNSTLKNKLTNVITMDREIAAQEKVIKRLTEVVKQYHTVYEKLVAVRVSDVLALYPDCETRRFFLDAQCRYEISDLYDTGANGGEWQYAIAYAGKRNIIKDYIYSSEYIYTWEVIN